MKKCISLMLILMMLTLSFNINYTRSKCATIVVPVVTVSVGHAIAYFLAICGIGVASAVVYENTENLESWGLDRYDDFKEYAISCGVRADNVNNWVNDLCKGVLNKSSDVWSTFKDWSSSLYPQSQDYAISNSWLGKGADAGIKRNDINISRDNSSLSLFKQYYINDQNVPTKINVIKWYASNGYYLIPFEYSNQYFSRDNMYSKNYNNTYILLDTWLSGPFNNDIVYKFADAWNIYFDYLIVHKNDMGNWDNVFNYITSQAYINSGTSDYINLGGVSGVYDRDSSLENYDVVPKVGNGTIADDTISLDWQKVYSDEKGLASELTDIKTGVIDLTGSMDKVGVIGIDKVTQKVIDNVGITDKPIDEVTTSSDINEYKVSLINVFPFCLPFDLVNFIRVLSAEPVAPRFTYTIKVPIFNNMESYDIDIDMSKFEYLANLFRKMELLAFVISLILITRQKIIRG